MKKLMKIFASIFTVLVIAVLVFIGWFFNLFAFTHDWHQKLAVVVETPQGVRSSSSVIRVAGEPGSGPHGNFHSLHTYGEAPVAKLPAADGKSRYLFVLLGRQKGLVKGLFRNELVAKGARFNYPSPASAWMSKVDKLTGTPAKQLLPNDYPLLVTFTDINDPKTVKRVDPDDLAESFGAGYSLKSITLEITDEPVAKGVVEGVLGWINTLNGRIKPYKGPTRNLADVPKVELLDQTDFLRRFK